MDNMVVEVNYLRKKIILLNSHQASSHKFNSVPTYFESIFKNLKFKFEDLIHEFLTGRYYIREDDEDDINSAYYILYAIYSSLNNAIELILPESLLLIIVLNLLFVYKSLNPFNFKGGKLYLNIDERI